MRKINLQTLAVFFLTLVLLMPLETKARENEENMEMKVKKIEKFLDEDFPEEIELKVLKHIPGGEGHSLFILDIDEDLRKKIEEKMLEHREVMIDLKSEKEKKEIEIERILMEDKLDTDKLMGVNEDILNIKKKMESEKMKNKIEIYKMIPEDKKERAKELIFSNNPFKFLKHMHGFKEGMEELREKMEMMKGKLENYRKL